MRRRAGWVFIDVLTGIILVGALAIILTAGARRQERGIHRLADTRAAYPPPFVEVSLCSRQNRSGSADSAVSR